MSLPRNVTKPFKPLAAGLLVLMLSGCLIGERLFETSERLPWIEGKAWCELSHTSTRLVSGCKQFIWREAAKHYNYSSGSIAIFTSMGDGAVLGEFGKNDRNRYEKIIARPAADHSRIWVGYATDSFTNWKAAQARHGIKVAEDAKNDDYDRVSGTRSALIAFYRDIARNPKTTGGKTFYPLDPDRSKAEQALEIVRRGPQKRIKIWAGAFVGKARQVLKKKKNKNRFAEAAAHLRLALDLNPALATDAGTQFALGRVHYSRKKYDQAVRAFNVVLAAYPNGSIVLYERAQAHAAMGNYRLALPDLDKAMALGVRGQDPAILMYTRGTYKNNLAQYASAISDFNVAIQKYREWAQAYNARGLAYRRMNLLGKAKADYDAAIRFAVKQKDRFQEGVGYLRRSWVFFLRGDMAAAERDAKKALELDPTFANAHVTLGQIYQKRGEKDFAIAHFRKALKLNPRLGEARDGLKKYGMTE